MIRCLDFNDARLTAINILSRDSVFIKSLNIIINEEGNYYVDYEEFNQDIVYDKILT